MRTYQDRDTTVHQELGMGEKAKFVALNSIGLEGPNVHLSSRILPLSLRRVAHIEATKSLASL